ncbi:MAG: hypothetical protein F4187_06180 [Gemmatimonadetes bacterium]|nr:hypothetical protein [Gemmatimonadota bacterium]
MRFTITAENDPAPKTPVTLLIEGVAIEPVTGGELSVTLPTKAAMDYAGPDDALYHPTGVKVSAIARWQLPAMAAGGRWKQRVTIPAMEKGYYRVAMSGATAGPPSDLGPFLIEEVYEQVWMFISDGRAQLTELFDPSVFPTGTRPVPGPILVRGLGRDAGDAAFAKPDTARRRYLYTSLSYYNGSEYVPAAGTRISGAYFPKRGGSGFNKETQTVPDNGINRWGCPGNNVTLKGSAIAQETEYITEAQWKLNAYWDAEKSECGDTIRVPASRYVYLPWYHLNESAENIQDHFGFERGRVKWRVRLTDESSYYTRWRDRITLNRRGYTSWWVAAHEYGHAIHNKALGGMWSTSNCNPHPVNKPTSYTCSFS